MITWCAAGFSMLLLTPLLLSMGSTSTRMSSNVAGIGNGFTLGWGSSGSSDCSATGSDETTGDGGSTTIIGMMVVPEKAKPWIKAASEASGGIPETFMAALMDRESDFDPEAFSPDINGGTWGLFQINRSEWTTYYPGATGTPPTGITDPMIHAQVGGQYLRARLDRVMAMQKTHPMSAYSQLTPLEALVIAHNAGEGNLQKYPNIPSITESYLAEIRAHVGQDINWTPTGTAPDGTVTPIVGQCSNGTVITGSVEAGGAPNVHQANFSWMCDAMKVCEAGDYGTFYPDAPAGYQCVWYAWTRLGMIHGTTGWHWVRGDGGEIWSNLQGQAGWTVDTTPHPGDGISATHEQSPIFAGTTHVAVVEEVADDPSGWKIRVSEGNMHQGPSAMPCYYGSKGCWNSYRGDRWLTKADLYDGTHTGPHFFRNDSWTTSSM